MTTTRQVLDAILAADLDVEVRSYSGRFMFGARCLAVVVDHESQLLRLGAALGAAGVDFDDLGHTRRDNMGTGLVLYWPSLDDAAVLDSIDEDGDG